MFTLEDKKNMGLFDYTYVYSGKCKPNSSNSILLTSHIASCLGVTLYDNCRKIGALAHIIRSSKNDLVKEITAETAVDILLHEINATENDYKNIEATLSGEGITFNKTTPYEAKSTIVRNRLNHYSINIAGEDLAEFYERSISLDCKTGDVTVYRKHVSLS